MAWAIQRIREESKQRLVGGGIYWCGGNFDAEFRSLRFADRALRSARLKLDGQCCSVGLSGDETRELPLTPSRFPSDGTRVAAKPGDGFAFPIVHSLETLPESRSR